MKKKHVPLRMCIGCKEMKNKKELLRIVDSAKENTFLIDLTGKHSGRGAYICKSQECFTKAKKQKSFDKAFKKSLSPDLYDSIESLLKENGE